MEEHNSVLDAILKVKDDKDGSIGIRCSCQQGICGSCGVRINGKPGLACNTHLEEAAKGAYGAGWNPPQELEEEELKGEGQSEDVVMVEPMGNMPVLRDLIVDMDAVHWRKIQRVTPVAHQQAAGPRARIRRPPRGHGRRHSADVLHPVRRVRLGLSLDGDRPAVHRPGGARQGLPLRRRPTRRPSTASGWLDLAEDPHGIYDCTHCFNCIDACPKGVDPMNQIMRLRRIAGSDFDIDDRNNGYRHEHAFVKNIRRNGLLHEPDLLADSYGGKFNPNAGRELVSGLPTAAKALARGKMTPKTALLHPHKAPKASDADVRPHRRQEGARRAQPVPLRAASRSEHRTQLREARRASDEGRLLARLCQPRLHP